MEVKFNRKEIKVVVKGMTGAKELYYETRLSRLGVSVLVSSGVDRAAQQALANELFLLLRGLGTVTLIDYTEATRKETLADVNNNENAGLPFSLETEERILRDLQVTNG